MTAVAAVVVLIIVVAVTMMLIVVVAVAIVGVAATVVLGARVAFEEDGPPVRAIAGTRCFAYMDRLARLGWRGSLALPTYLDMDMDSLTWPALPEGFA
jgi:hypothetical protein